MRRGPTLAYLLLLPALIIFAGYILYPIVHTFLLGFSSWSTVNQVRLSVGWKNYADLLHDPNFYVALRNNGLFILLSLAVQLPLALLIALGVGSALRRHQLLPPLFFAPFVLPVVAVGLIAAYLIGAVYYLFIAYGHGASTFLSPHFGLHGEQVYSNIIKKMQARADVNWGRWTFLGVGAAATVAGFGFAAGAGFGLSTFGGKGLSIRSSPVPSVCEIGSPEAVTTARQRSDLCRPVRASAAVLMLKTNCLRSEEHTSELQSH